AKDLPPRKKGGHRLCQGGRRPRPRTESVRTSSVVIPRESGVSSTHDLPSRRYPSLLDHPPARVMTSPTPCRAVSTRPCRSTPCSTNSGARLSDATQQV